MLIKIGTMFLLRYPKPTVWHNRDNIPEPHIRKTDLLNSFSMKETKILIFIIVFVIISVFLFWKFPRHKYKFMVVITLFLIGFMLFPLTSLLVIGLFITSFTRTPSIYLDKNLYFPQAFDLEKPETFEKIKKETINLLKDQKKIPFADDISPSNKYIASDKNNGDGWRTYTIKTANMISPKARKKMPFVASLLEKMPNVTNALISVLPSKTSIPIHHGYYKGFVRYHLGIVIPEPDKTILHVNGNKYHWQVGEGVIWDDMFPHEVYNSSNETRAILYLDIVRTFPTSKLGTDLNRWYCKFLSKSPIVKYMQSLDEKLK